MTIEVVLPRLNSYISTLETPDPNTYAGSPSELQTELEAKIIVLSPAPFSTTLDFKIIGALIL